MEIYILYYIYTPYKYKHIYCVGVVYQTRSIIGMDFDANDVEEIVANKTLIDGRQGLRAQEDQMNTKENNGMNNLNDNVNSVVTTTSLQPAPFLLKTYNVVSDEETIDMVAWAPDGRRYE